MLRQHQLHVRHGISAAKFDKPIFGVKGPFILSQMMPDVSSITVDHFEQSKQLLLAFVSKSQVLYDPKFMVSNVHALLHLPEVVEDLGPLWTTSCFPFEDLLGKMVDYVHGTRYVGLQIHTK
ncbi:hypothetical protein PV326_009124, partial [Microctonus aethiopoides]